MGFLGVCSPKVSQAALLTAGTEGAPPALRHTFLLGVPEPGQAASCSHSWPQSFQQEGAVCSFWARVWRGTAIPALWKASRPPGPASCPSPGHPAQAPIPVTPPVPVAPLRMSPLAGRGIRLGPAGAEQEQPRPQRAPGPGRPPFPHGPASPRLHSPGALSSCSLSRPQHWFPVSSLPPTPFSLLFLGSLQLTE